MHLLRNHENWAFVQVMSDADGTDAIVAPSRRYRRMGW